MIKLRLDDPIQKYVPAFPDKGSIITLRHILTQTSGIRHYRPGDFPGSVDNENMKPVATLEEAIRIFKDDPLLFKPGERYFYSSYAFNLLQGVIETASGLAFEDYMRRFVWNLVNHCGTVKGYNACLVIYPDRDLVVAILGNGYPTPARREAVAIARLFLSP